MTGYTKLFGSLVTSSVWAEPHHVRIVWVTMLAVANRDGVVEASVPGLANLARVTLGECEEALQVFRSPDPYSRTKAFEGRRIEDADGGWRLLNHDSYRHKLSAEEQREKAAERQRRKRERETIEESGLTPRDSHAPSRPVTLCHAPSRPITPDHARSRQAEAEADTEAGSLESVDQIRSRAREQEAPAPARARLPSSPVPGQPLRDWLREGVTAGYHQLKLPAPRQTRDLTWPGWVDLERWVLEKAELLQRPPDDVGRHLVRCFLRSSAARERGHPIAYLVANATEYWRDELPEVA